MQKKYIYQHRINVNFISVFHPPPPRLEDKRTRRVRRGRGRGEPSGGAVLPPRGPSR